MLVQGPQGPRLIGGHKSCAGPSQSDHSWRSCVLTDRSPSLFFLPAQCSVPMATVSTGDGSSKALNAASTTLSTIKVTVPGTIPKTVVSMATAVLSADGTIVVTLPPGADPKNFVVNPASINPGALTDSGVMAPGVMSSGVMSGSGAAESRVMTPGVMPRPAPTSGEYHSVLNLIFFVCNFWRTEVLFVRPRGYQLGVGLLCEHNLFVVGVSPAGQKGKPGSPHGGWVLVWAVVCD